MNLLKTYKLKNYKSNDVRGTDSLKFFPTSTREWNNSIYAYNKNTLNLLPMASSSATKIIKNYFSLMDTNIEKELITGKVTFRRRKKSKNRIFVGNNEFKHTNNKVIINLYLFNRQNKNYEIILKKKYDYWKKRKKYSWKEYNKKYNIKGIFWSEYKKKFYEKINSFIYNLNLIKINNDVNKRIIFSSKYLSNFSLKKVSTILEPSLFEFENKLREKALDRWELYFCYRQLILLNKQKFNYTFLLHLKKYLQALFNKDIEFNIINLKRFYLNSSIMSESIRLKLSKNRRSLFRHLNKLKEKVKIKDKNNIKPILSKKIKYSTNIQKNIINNIKYKDVTGFRLEAKGRLTRRHTASRSVTKVKYKGNLLNLDSSRKGLSTVMLKGNLESNLQFTKLKSKTRIGSFGLKGWVSGN